MIQYFSLPRISKSVAKGKRSFPVRGNINIIFRLSGTWPFRNYGTLLIVEGERFFSSFLVNFFLFFQLFSFGRRFYYIDNIFKIYSKYDIRITTFWRMKSSLFELRLTLQQVSAQSIYGTCYCYIKIYYQNQSSKKRVI